jgi:hypothetical protein
MHLVCFHPLRQGFVFRSSLVFPIQDSRGAPLGLPSNHVESEKDFHFLLPRPDSNPDFIIRNPSVTNDQAVRKDVTQGFSPDSSALKD